MHGARRFPPCPGGNQRRSGMEIGPVDVLPGRRGCGRRCRCTSGRAGSGWCWRRTRPSASRPRGSPPSVASAGVEVVVHPDRLPRPGLRPLREPGHGGPLLGRLDADQVQPPALWDEDPESHRHAPTYGGRFGPGGRPGSVAASPVRSGPSAHVRHRRGTDMIRDGRSIRQFCQERSCPVTPVARPAPRSRAPRSRTIKITQPAASPIAALRIVLGFVFLWAFLDKLFGLGYATAGARVLDQRRIADQGLPERRRCRPVPVASSTPSPAPGGPNILFMLGLLAIGVAAHPRHRPAALPPSPAR